jgi:energy-coupling factor transport system ATP-binding protein
MTFRADHVSFAYKKHNRSRIAVIDDLTFTVRSGECVAILGREGSGKSTLLHLLGGLLLPDTGTLQTIDAPDGPDRRNGNFAQRRLGFTFQFPEEQFLRETIEEEFRDVLTLHSIPQAEIPQRTAGALRDTGLDPDLVARRSPFTLSLGESRRVALALILAMTPRAAIMDEPTAGLDAGGVRCTLQGLSSLHGAGTTVIVATHDIRVAAVVAERIVIMDHGRIAEDGPTERMLSNRKRLKQFGYDVPHTDSGSNHEKHAVNIRRTEA